MTDQTATEEESLHEDLCAALESVLPEKIFDLVASIRPIGVSIAFLSRLGGTLALDFPHIDLNRPYDIPDEVMELNDTIGDMTFTVAKLPILALTCAFQADEDIDEIIIRSHDLEGFFPIIIEENKKPIHVFLIDNNSKTLEIPISPSSRIDIRVSGTPEEIEESKLQGLGEIKKNLENLKESTDDLFKRLIETEGFPIIEEWLERHSYKLKGVVMTGIDIWQASTS